MFEDIIVFAGRADCAKNRHGVLNLETQYTQCQCVYIHVLGANTMVAMVSSVYKGAYTVDESPPTCTGVVDRFVFVTAWDC